MSLAMEFWNSELTEKSWQVLQQLKKEYNFVLIGGWAVYLWAKQQKSKDIDIVIDLIELEKLKSQNLSKNDKLSKYEIKKGEIDIDIYVPYFSKLCIPLEKINSYSEKIEGFNIISKEALIILKQDAEISRRNSIKGEKDKVDIVSLLLFTDFDFKKYVDFLKEFKKENFVNELIHIVKNFNDFNKVNLTPLGLKKKKRDLLIKLKNL